MPWYKISLVMLLTFSLIDSSAATSFADSPTTASESADSSKTATDAENTSEAKTKGVVERKSSDASIAKGDITFDDLKFDIEKDAAFEKGALTPDVKRLDGIKVKLRGYILPSTLFKETDIDQFVLVRDNQECCFGPGAALFDCVIVEMLPGRTTDFVTRPVTVEGKFKIDTEKYKYPGGKGPGGASHFAIFRIEGMSVK
ncbi:lipoprotein [Rhodopirellula maiorica SM1]|uniref:Lipoprotein n=1 Tax=Rhodopirellula maiorica SM1 TaxID=1265738 RepID=M5RBX5_9BACT|nr:DUF3299 domain-containing protein [Rhodopirellula maiorica]EMI16576.1 lipoprotein [Rhodopirellula maiorica SM1]